MQQTTEDVVAEIPWIGNTVSLHSHYKSTHGPFY